jgi:hypothetical protein
MVKCYVVIYFLRRKLYFIDCASLHYILLDTDGLFVGFSLTEQVIIRYRK